jgi:hypothetical protein
MKDQIHEELQDTRIEVLENTVSELRKVIGLMFKVIEAQTQVNNAIKEAIQGIGEL